MTTPREVFAISEKFPKLHKELGFDYIYVVSTTPCTFGGVQQACNMWWNGAGRGARAAPGTSSRYTGRSEGTPGNRACRGARLPPGEGTG